MNLKTRAHNNYRTQKILGIRVDFTTLAEILIRVKNWVNSNKQYQITTPNPEHIVIAQSDYRFKNIINNSALAVPDGVGIVWAAKLFGNHRAEVGANFCSVFKSWAKDIIQKIESLAPHCKHKNTHKNCTSSRVTPFRLSGTDLMLAVVKLAYTKNWRVFLLGGGDEVAKKAAENLKKQSAINNQQLTIKYFAGSQNIQNETKAERQQTIQKINKFRPQLLFVAFGAPMQEKWIAKNLPKLPTVKVAMGVGGAFDFLAGQVKRAPKWVRKLGLEWLYRLGHEPWRWKRQLRLVKFVFLVLKEKLLK